MKRFFLVCVLMGCDYRGDLDIKWTEAGRSQPTFDFHMDTNPDDDDELLNNFVEIPITRF